MTTSFCMPNLNIKNTSPNTGIKNDSPNIRVSSFQTTRSGEMGGIVAGNPIGLLLTLTYAGAIGLPQFGDFRPNMRIYNY